MAITVNKAAVVNDAISLSTQDVNTLVLERMQARPKTLPKKPKPITLYPKARNRVDVAYDSRNDDLIPHLCKQVEYFYLDNAGRSINGHYQTKSLNINLNLSSRGRERYIVATLLVARARSSKVTLSASVFRDFATALAIPELRPHLENAVRYLIKDRGIEQLYYATIKDSDKNDLGPNDGLVETLAVLYESQLKRASKSVRESDVALASLHVSNQQAILNGTPVYKWSGANEPLRKARGKKTYDTNGRVIIRVTRRSFDTLVDEETLYQPTQTKRRRPRKPTAPKTKRTPAPEVAATPQNPAVSPVQKKAPDDAPVQPSQGDALDAKQVNKPVLPKTPLKKPRRTTFSQPIIRKRPSAEPYTPAPDSPVDINDADTRINRPQYTSKRILHFARSALGATAATLVTGLSFAGLAYAATTDITATVATVSQYAPALANNIGQGIYAKASIASPPAVMALAGLYYLHNRFVTFVNGPVLRVRKLHEQARKRHFNRENRYLVEGHRHDETPTLRVPKTESELRSLTALLHRMRTEWAEGVMPQDITRSYRDIDKGLLNYLIYFGAVTVQNDKYGMLDSVLELNPLVWGKNPYAKRVAGTENFNATNILKRQLSVQYCVINLLQSGEFAAAIKNAVTDNKTAGRRLNTSHFLEDMADCCYRSTQDHDVFEKLLENGLLSRNDMKAIRKHRKKLRTISIKYNRAHAAFHEIPFFKPKIR